MAVWQSLGSRPKGSVTQQQVEAKQLQSATAVVALSVVLSFLFFSFLFFLQGSAMLQCCLLCHGRTAVVKEGGCLLVITRGRDV
jgi:hypothetical protein